MQKQEKCSEGKKTPVPKSLQGKDNNAGFIMKQRVQKGNSQSYSVEICAQHINIHRGETKMVAI